MSDDQDIITQVTDGEFGQNITGPGQPYDNANIRDKMIAFAGGIVLIAEAYRKDSSVNSHIDLIERKSNRSFKRHYVKSEDITNIEANSAAPVVIDEKVRAESAKQLETLFNESIQKRATDIHFYSTPDSGLIVRIRVDKLMRDFKKLRAQDAVPVLTAAYMFADSGTKGSNYMPRESQKAIITRVGWPNMPRSIKGIRLQFNPLVNNCSELVGRILTSMTKLARSADQLEMLGHDTRQRHLFAQILNSPRGITLISAAPNNGKTTTLGSLMSILVTMSKGTLKLTSIEDPHELEIPGVMQMALPDRDEEEESARDLTRAIMACVRSDVDYALIGEVRNAETASTMITAAARGLGVFATTHAVNANSTPELLTSNEFKVPSDIIYRQGILQGLCGQQLFPKLCEHCRQPMKAVRDTDHNHGELHAYMNEIKGLKYDDIYIAGEGCQKCDMTGYHGLVMVSEVLIPDQQYLRLHRNGDRIEALNHLRMVKNMPSMMDHAIKLIKSKNLSPYHMAMLGEIDVASLNDYITKHAQ